MGNHVAGRAMVKIAEALKEKSPELPALEILDIACSNYRNCDAEFDDALYDGGVFHQLLIEAFGPEPKREYEIDEGVKSETYDSEYRYYSKIYRPFFKRYGLT